MLTQTMIHRSHSRHPAGHVAHPVPVVNPHALGASIELMGAPMPFARNAEIYGENEPAEYLYKVVSGSVRTYKVLNDGRRQIGAFYLPGDVFGLEVGDEHTFSAEAIVNSKVLAAAPRSRTTRARGDERRSSRPTSTAPSCST